MDLGQLLLRICAPILSQLANRYMYMLVNTLVYLLNPRHRPQLLLCMFRAFPETRNPAYYYRVQVLLRRNNYCGRSYTTYKRSPYTQTRLPLSPGFCLALPKKDRIRSHSSSQ